MVTKINPQRFSKATLSAYVSKRISQIEAKYGFIDETGWVQCVGKPSDVWMAYGERESLRDLFEHFELVRHDR